MGRAVELLGVVATVAVTQIPDREGGKGEFPPLTIQKVIPPLRSEAM